MVRRKVPVAAVVSLSALVALGTLIGPWGLGFALLVVVIVLAAGWPTLLHLPTQRGSTTVLACCGAVSTIIMLLAAEDPLRYVAAWMALSVIITFAHQLLRRDYRPRLVESVTGVVSGVVTANLTVGWLTTDSKSLVVLAAVCVAAASVGLALPLPRRFGIPFAVLGAAVVAAVVATWSPLGTLPAVLIGLLVALVAVGLARLFAHLPSMSSRAAGLAAGAATVASTGMIVYLAEAVLSRL